VIHKWDSHGEFTRGDAGNLRTSQLFDADTRRGNGNRCGLPGGGGRPSDSEFKFTKRARRERGAGKIGEPLQAHAPAVRFVDRPSTEAKGSQPSASTGRRSVFTTQRTGTESVWDFFFFFFFFFFFVFLTRERDQRLAETDLPKASR